MRRSIITFEERPNTRERNLQRAEEEPSVKSVSGPARHVGEADNRVRDSRGGSPCGENRCGIGECREGEKLLIKK